ncbi:MAG: hypothetical protein V3W34_05480 [Phycisphaerae bacterium]
MNANDNDTVEQAMRLRRMIADRLKNMTPQEQDRLMQTYMAQARGPIGNAMVLRQMAAAIAGAREANETQLRNPSGESSR